MGFTRNHQYQRYYRKQDQHGVARRHIAEQPSFTFKRHNDEYTANGQDENLHTGFEVVLGQIGIGKEIQVAINHQQQQHKPFAVFQYFIQQGIILFGVKELTRKCDIKSTPATSRKNRDN